MSDERINEPGGWKDRLDRLDALPGEPWTDKEAAWDRLHACLHEKQGRKKRPGWWLAAAALLLAVAGTVSVLLHKKEPPLVIRDPQRPVPSAVFTPAVAGANQVLTKENAGLPLQQQAMAGSRQRAVIKRGSITTAFPLRSAGNTTDTSVSLKTGIIPTPADTPLLTRIATPPKKQLRVIAFNELEQAQPDSNLPPLPMRRPVRRSLRLLLSHNEAAAATTSERQEENNNPFKINISPQN